MTTTGQRLIASAKEALAFARGEVNDYVLHYKINNDLTMDLKVEVIDKASDRVSGLPVHDMESLA